VIDTVSEPTSQSAGLSNHDQQRFARVVTQKLRESRRRQKLTQADVANRTRGLVSKAALANYETGHRSLRIDVLWVIARALGEDLGNLLSSVEHEVAGAVSEDSPSTIGVRVANLMRSPDSRLDPVRRWFELRRSSSAEATEDEVVHLDHDALRALGELMQVNPSDLRRMLTEHL
jgi:transcriptional regulator with XRE-family HTH domain